MKSNQTLIVFLMAIALWTTNMLNAEPAVSADKADYVAFIREWIRPDGGYFVRVNDIKPDGSVDAEYFNPNKINVAEANVSMWKGFKKLYINLQDKGYPGSTYTLYYYVEKDLLAGFYYQAKVEQTFEVVFIRKKK